MGSQSLFRWIGPVNPAEERPPAHGLAAVSVVVSVDRTCQPAKPTADIDLENDRESVRHDRPFGSSAWTQETARILGLDYSLRLRGRPRAFGPPAGDETT